MLRCPKCHEPLQRRQNQFGSLWFCAACDGSAITISLLRKFIHRDTINRIWQGARTQEHARKCKCPGCQAMMEEVPIQTPVGERHVGVCGRCQFIWLDKGEFESLPSVGLPERKLTVPEGASATSVEGRAAILTRKAPAKPMQRKVPVYRKPVAAPAPEPIFSADGPDAAWQWIPALLGMPIEKAPPTEGESPLLTWMMIAAITLFSLLAFTDIRAVVDALGLIPADFERKGGLTFLTSFFLHAGPMHLIGNLYFLWIFGDDVERQLGSFQFLFLLGFAALMGGVLHVCFDPGSQVPCIGASGGISGIMAFYALRFRASKISVMFWLIIKIVWFRLSAIWMFGVWLFLQFVIAGQQLAGLTNVSAAAHLGGALAGAFIWWLVRSSDDELQPRMRRTQASR